MFERIFYFFDKGGPVMVPLAVFSIAALAIIIERIIYYIQADRTLKTLAVTDIPNETESRKNPVLSIFFEGMHTEENDRDVLQKLMSDEAEIQTPSLERFLTSLSVIGRISPLLGLLGTVTGMIKTFAVISSAGVGNPKLLSAGISQALFTTAFGLVIAIPTILAYYIFVHKVDRIVREVEKTVLSRRGVR